MAAVEVGDPVTAEMLDRALRPPVVKLVQQSAQTLAYDTDTPITFGASSEVLDTHNFHDTVTNNTRITPTVPGLYECRGILWLAADTTVAQIYASIFQNGSVATPRARLVMPIDSGGGVNDLTSASAARTSMQISGFLSFNGSTDYAEFSGRFLRTTGTTTINTSIGGSFSSVFEMKLIADLT